MENYSGYRNDNQASISTWQLTPEQERDIQRAFELDRNGLESTIFPTPNPTDGLENYGSTEMQPGSIDEIEGLETSTLISIRNALANKLKKRK